jgi:hypothetical protein
MHSGWIGFWQQVFEMVEGENPVRMLSIRDGNSDFSGRGRHNRSVRCIAGLDCDGALVVLKF